MGAPRITLIRRRPAVAGSIILVCTLLASSMASGQSTRIDVPVSQIVLPSGEIRYSVPVSVGGGQPMDAELDTGSFGLRVLSKALEARQYESTGIERHYAFGGGARFNGVLAKADIAVGDARTATPVLFQLIQTVDCTAQKPKCPASRLGAKDYRIAGSGFAGLGYDAIIGLSLRKAPTAAAADNPLGALGTGRWIVLLPRPGQSAPGHLIINPAADEVAGFSLFHLQPQPSGQAEADRAPGWKDTALSGCLINEASKERFCGETLLDSGASGFSMTSSDVSSATTWPEGTSVTLQLSGADRPIEIPFRVGKELSSKVRLMPDKGQSNRLSAGSLPYYSYAVFYDQQNGLLGMKARDDAQP